MSSKSSQNGNIAVRALLSTIIASSGLLIEFTLTNTGEPDSTEGRLIGEFTGPDTPLLTARNGELLNAMELIAAEVLRLEDHDRIFFDADSYKADRNRELQRSAAEAIASVRKTGRPYAFRPMTSHERRPAAPGAQGVWVANCIVRGEAAAIRGALSGRT